MPKRKKTNKLQRLLLSWPFLILLLVLVILIASAAWSMFQTRNSTRSTVERLDEDRRELLERRDSVSAEAVGLSNERGLEEEIREKFSVAKEGERVIVLVDDEEEAATTTLSEKSWWQRTLDTLWPF